MTEKETHLLKTVAANAELIDLWGKMLFMLVQSCKITDDTVQIQELSINMRKRSQEMKAFVASYENRPKRSMNILHKGIF